MIKHLCFTLHHHQFYFQKSEIETVKKNFDINLSSISQQLEILQKSLKKREKFIKKTIKEKDKVC